ncbi:MAG: hypothetical protein AABZ57_05670 [Candidatus Margulisiibacteriota bacterium]
MAETKKVSSFSSPLRGPQKSMETVPSYVHPIIRRFWKFTRDMAKKFSGNLLKDRSEELVKNVNDYFSHGM